MFQQFCEMAHWVEMYKEIAVLRDEIEVQRRLAAYWEGRWKHEYSEKIELLHQNLELKRKYEGISEEALTMAQNTTAMGFPEEAQRTGIARPQVNIFHAKKRGKRPEQCKRGRPVAKKGRGVRGVKILETLKEDTPGGNPSGEGPLHDVSQEDQTPIALSFCGYCRKSNHMEVDCWKKDGRCLRCGSTEHRIANCPSLLREKKGTQQPTQTDPGPSNREGTGMKSLVSSEDEEGTGHWLL